MSLRGTQFTPQHTSTMPDFTVGAIENQSGPEHWVSRLFQPTYRDVDSSDEMKTILGNRLTAIDPEALRNVFHRVHALLTAQNEILNEPVRKTTAGPLPGVEPVAPKPEPLGTDQECIWDESEMSVLRAHYKQVQAENTKLKSHLKYAEQRLASLDSKYTKTRQSNEETVRNLNEAKQANARLQIMAETLKKDNEIVNSENDDLKEQVKSLQLERLDLIDKLKKARIDSNHDRIEKKNLELELRENGRILLETSAHLESKLRVKYQKEVNELNLVIEDLKEQLSEERRSHTAARKGLDHLRTHFASLPVEHGLVTDQLSDLKLY